MRGVLIALFVLAIIIPPWRISCQGRENAATDTTMNEMDANKTVTLFLTGDVMPGRGIDQILRHSVDPVLHEPYVRDARGYVELAEQANGPLTGPVEPAYIWGDALGVLRDAGPDLRIINLETSITTSGEYWPKGINYRMHPDNTEVLTAAAIDCCVLANNHVLDWGYTGLLETLQTLEKAGIQQAGAGRDRLQAARPAIFDIPGKGRVLIFAYGSPTSGIPFEWEAAEARPGINVVPDLSIASAMEIQETVAKVRQPGDIVVLSIHWGGNWGYDIPEKQRNFAHWLIDKGGVDLIHGHSSHHVKGIEVYRDKLILYGCGDFLNDYEGISGYEEFRDDLTLMYLPRLSASTGKLLELRMVPMQIKRFQTVHPKPEDARWLYRLLNRLGAEFNTVVELNKDNSLSLLRDEE